MEKICNYKSGEWKCLLTSKANSNFCCLHSEAVHEQTEITKNLYQLSQTDNHILLAYDLINFQTPKNPAIRFKNKSFQRGLWSSIIWNNDFFNQCDFLNLEIENITMEACVLEDFQFKNCNFFGYSDLRSNWLRGSFESLKSEIQSFRLEGVKIENCLFSNCSWENLYFYNCVMREVYFADCVFEQASFIHCDFIDCRFEGNSGILAMENCHLEACQTEEPEDQLLISQLNCSNK